MNYCLSTLLIFLCIGFNSTGQENLILNGDFEEYSVCPDNLTQIERCLNVYNPLYSPPPAWSTTSDYFNSCAFTFTDASTPNNEQGYQQPQSGNAYVGMLMSRSEFNYYLEYIQLEFSIGLEAGETYAFTVYANLANNVEYSCPNIQFKFIETNLDYNVLLSDIMDADVKYDTLITDTVGWTKIEFEYEATGGEKYLIIGNFDDINQTPFTYLYNLPGISDGQTTYFYFDNASLIDLNVTIEFPNVFTPNGDNTNDVFGPLTGASQIEKYYILNRWGNVIFESDSNLIWDGKNSSGVSAKDGVYFYKVIPKEFDSENKSQYNGYFNLMR
ncbi:MAG: gliding motility-associated-like protein [Flavobacteriaceae bacterium]